MGVIEAGRESMAAAEQRRLDAIREVEELTEGREEVIGEIMVGLSDVLAQPEFTGDVETALVHYIGPEAFWDEVGTGRYTELVAKIKAQPYEEVPLLFVFKEQDIDGRHYGPETNFLVVPRDNIQFHSKRTHTENARMHAFTTERAGVTRSSLAISGIGQTTRFKGDILAPGEKGLDKREHLSELVLAEAIVADGGAGAGLPSDYAFSDHGIERFYENPTVLIGWGNIETAFADRLTLGLNNFDEALKIQKFLYENVGGMDEIRKYFPNLAGVVAAVAHFQASIDSIRSSV